MRWVAPSEKDAATATLEERLWDAADQFRANSGLKSQEYSSPVLGLIFLRFAEVDRGKAKTPRADIVLFIDARHIYRQIDRAHREWTPAQIGFLANLVRLYRSEAPDYTLGGDEARAKLEETFGKKPKYADVPGLCQATTLKEIEAQGWSLNPGRHVGVAPGEAVSDEDFKEQLEALNEELETLNAQARDLEQTIAGNVAEILSA
jgi:type I restriction enzyme M protein